jgi:tetratricopeptide (TPR) repeat protein
MHIFYRSFDWAASRLHEYLASSTSQKGWDLLNLAVPVVYNNSKNLMFSCVCPPESHFEFHSSVVRSKRRHGTFVALFRRSMDILQPVLQLADADPSNPESVAAMERCLGCSVFDAAAHLVALASTSLHDTIEKELCSVTVKYQLDVIDSSMNAYVSSEGEFVGRSEEIGKIDRCMGPVFQGSQPHCVLALVHGIPGTGKSRLAKRQLELLQRQKDRLTVRSAEIQGRGRGAVRDGLHKMGLALAEQLMVGTSASVDEVLLRLKKFLQTQRFVILADDADTEVLDELLKHVPKSSKPCALVLTSQFGQDITQDLLQRSRENRLPFSFSMKSDSDIQLDKFDPDTALELVGKMCLAQNYDSFNRLDHAHDLYTPAPPPESGQDRETHRAFCFFWSIRSWLREALKQKNLDYLPLAVHALSMWLRQELQRSDSNAASMLTRWSIAINDDFVGESSSGHRAINATVRLALHNIGSRFSELDDACRQLLGLLALCRPQEVPWSLFDGVSLVSAMGQPCKVRREDDSGRCAVYDDAVVASDALDGDGIVVQVLGETKLQRIPCSSVVFGPRIVGMIGKDGRYQVQLLTPQPYMRGARIELYGFVKAVTNNGLQGRVIQHHADDTVSVVFGCETGACRTLAAPALSFCNICAGELSELKPGAEVKRFKAGNVRMRSVDGVAAAVLEVEGLKRVAAALRSSGLVQVDEQRRTFGMHQLLQQAVGRELGWGQQCMRMRQLLQARCGRFGDEPHIDVGLYGIMREIAQASFCAVERVRAEEARGTHSAWCSGMLLRLYEVAREVYGTEAEFPLRVIAAAHSSIVADLVSAHLMEKGSQKVQRQMKLLTVVNDVLDAPDFKDLFSLFDVDIIGEVTEEVSKRLSLVTADDMVIDHPMDVRKCLSLQWVSLYVRLVRLHVIQEGSVSIDGARVLPMSDIAVVPLIQDIATLCNQVDLGQFLKDAQGLRVICDDTGCGICSLEASEFAEEDRSAAVRHDLRAMRWRLHTFRGNEHSREKVITEIRTVYSATKGIEEHWNMGVALGAVLSSAAGSYRVEKNWDHAISAYQSALNMLDVTLGRDHPVTASTLSSYGTTYSDSCDRIEQVKAIELFKQALRIETATLGQHPATAGTMSSLGAAYGKMNDIEMAIGLFEQALHIYECTVGRMHRDAANVILSLSTAYALPGRRQNQKRAEQLIVQALDICTKILGSDHEQTTQARQQLERMQILFRKASSRR